VRGHGHFLGHLLKSGDPSRHGEGARVAGFARDLPPHRSTAVAQEVLQHTASGLQGGGDGSSAMAELLSPPCTTTH
jgi:hypothetical protein